MLSLYVCGEGSSGLYHYQCTGLYEVNFLCNVQLSTMGTYMCVKGGYMTCTTINNV